MYAPFANKTQNPPRAGLFSTVLAILAVLIVAGLTPASATAQAKIQAAPSGAEAIAILGDRLSEVAESHDLTEARLRSLLLEDETLRVTPAGDLFYICPEAPDMPLDKEAAALSKEAPFDLAETFLLHSNPGAEHVLYIDFDGHVTTSPVWTQFNGDQPINSAPYDTDGQPLVFSDVEREFIQLTWQYVAEDMLPFDIDVTTEEPPLDRLQYGGPGDVYWGVRVVVSATNFFGGDGVAFLGSFDSAEDLPAFVFNQSLESCGETVSHEAGHTFGLSHDGSPAVAYYPGHGMGVTSWGPLMGSTFTVNVSQWNAGDYLGANNLEDDLAIISSLDNGNGFGYRTDDHGDTNPSATGMLFGPGVGPITGIVERKTDVDVFRFFWPGGAMNLQITPFTPKPNLRVHAELEPESGGPVTVLDRPDALDAAFSAVADPGNYYLKISGTGYGTPWTGFSDYASLGAYQISLETFQEAVPGGVYATQGYAGTTALVQIDPVTGGAAVIGNTGVGGLPGLAINDQGEMYGAGGPISGVQNLYRIDAATGAAALIGDTGVGCLQALTFEPGGRLLGIGNCGADELFQVDLATGSAVPLVSVEPNMVGMAFDPITGALYGVEWNNFSGIDNLYTIDVAGATSLVGSLGLGVGVGDIHFDAAGNLFGVVGGGAGPNSYVAIEKTTGAATVIGPTGIGALTGLSSFGVDPAPVPDIETPMPTAYVLRGAFPNPFNPMTRISYELPADGHVTINVFDPAGRRVKTLVDGQQSAGRHELSFNAERLGSGVYFYEMRAGDFREVRKMTLLK